MYSVNFRFWIKIVTSKTLLKAHFSLSLENKNKSMMKCDFRLGTSQKVVAEAYLSSRSLSSDVIRTIEFSDQIFKLNRIMQEIHVEQPEWLSFSNYRKFIKFYWLSSSFLLIVYFLRWIVLNIQKILVIMVVFTFHG